jgi:uncharacterized protein YjbI with pentapeptide repeats
MGRGNEESQTTTRTGAKLLHRNIQIEPESKKSKKQKKGSNKKSAIKSKGEGKISTKAAILDTFGDEVIRLSGKDSDVGKLLAEEIYQQENVHLFEKADLSQLILDGINTQEKRKVKETHLEALAAASFTGAKMNKTSIKNAIVPEVNFSSINGKDCDFSGSDLRSANFIRAILKRANLKNSNAQGAFFAEADLRDSNLSDANLEDVIFWDADLRKADLSGADLRGADLRGADLRGVDLRRADLRGADLRQAKWKGAKWDGADLHGAKTKDAHDI